MSRDAWAERIAEMERKKVARIGQAREWNGNVELVTIKAGTVIRKDADRKPTQPAPTPAPSKFRNVKTDGYASKKEAARAGALRLMQAAGEIRNLREQVEYVLIPKQEGERACGYRADFVYERPAPQLGLWLEVVEDTKGVRTPDYIIKRKLMLQVHGIRIREV